MCNSFVFSDARNQRIAELRINVKR